MQPIRKGITVILSLLLGFAFVQIAGSYLITQLSQNAGTVYEIPSEEQTARQMVLQLEPVEYYTIQLGVCENVKEAQEKIDQLAQRGYRVFVSDGPPYNIWLGCFGSKPDVSALPQEIKNGSPDLFVQKRILNEQTLKFSADDSFVMERLAALISSYDVVLKHSLQMFQDYRYELCSDENWNAMTEQIIEELHVISTSAEMLLDQDMRKSAGDQIEQMEVLTEAYEQSLYQIREKKNDYAVWIAQSCLHELIAGYHDFMSDESSNKINL